MTKKASRKHVRPRKKRGRLGAHASMPQHGEQAQKTNRTYHAVVGALVVALACLGVLWGGGLLDSMPGVVVPKDLDELDPQFGQYLKEYIESARQAPEEADRHAALALVYGANGRWAEARASFRNAVRLSPGDVLPKYYLAISTQRIGDHEDVITMLRQLVEEHPSFAPAHHRLGSVLLEQGAIEDAAKAFQQAISLRPDAAEGYIGLADVKLRNRKYADAVELLQRAVKLNARDRTAHYLLGTAYRGLGRLEDAERELKVGSDAKKRYMSDEWSASMLRHAKGVAHQVQRARRLLQQKKPRQAAAVLETALAWHPANVELLNNLAIAYLDMKQAPKARDLLLRAEEIGDNAMATYINLAACFLELEQLDDALRYADRSIELGPTVSQAYLTRSRVLKQLARGEDAVAALQAALRFDERNAAIRLELARQYLALDRPADARPLFAGLAARFPSRVRVQLWHCDVCIRLGQWDEAAAALAAARRVAPEDQRVVTMTERLRRLRGQ